MHTDYASAASAVNQHEISLAQVSLLRRISRRVHGATPHPYQRRRQGGSAPLIKYHLVLGLFKMPQKYALLVAYKADCGGRGCAAQHRRPFYCWQHLSKGATFPRALSNHRNRCRPEHRRCPPVRKSRQAEAIALRQSHVDLLVQGAREKKLQEIPKLEVMG
jgi:hypothetical protein